MEEKSFDRNQLIGFLLIGAILIAYFLWFAEPEQAETEQTGTQNTEQVESDSPANPATTSSVLETDSNTVAMPTDSLNSSVKDTLFWLENDLLKIGVSNIGGQIVHAQLKSYQTWDSLPLNLVDSNQILGFRLGTAQTSLNQTYTGSISGDDSTQVLMLNSDESDGGSFSIMYSLTAGSYQLGINVSGKGFAGSQQLYADWQLDALRTEKSMKTERQKATIYYWQEDDFDYLSISGEDEETAEKLNWLAYKQHFFSSILDPGVEIKSARMALAPFENEEMSKRMKSEILLGDVSGNFSQDLKLYYGPNKFNILKEYDNTYKNIIDFGWGIFGWISRGVVIPIFNWLEQYGLNYGLIILIMALMIKIVLFPLTYTSYKSMAKMRVLKPEMDVINEKYKDKDSVKKNQAVMELYQQAGVNPLGGCIPMVVQMPILIAMFRFFPASIELRQQSFLWATDLSSYDSIVSWDKYIPLLSDFYGNHISLFTLLMTISTLIYTWMNSQMQATNQQIPGMKIMMYGMPIMLLFWFNSYSSGLSYYYFVANIITFSQQYFIRRSMDDEAIHAKLQAKRAQPKKKSKFQARMEDMAKQRGVKMPKK